MSSNPESKLYSITVKPEVDQIHLYDENNTMIGMMNPAEDYDTMMLSQNDVKVFTLPIPADIESLNVHLMGYGNVGGTTEYKINDVLSVPICDESKYTQKYKSPIIINTPNQIRDVLIQIPESVRKLTGLGEWYQPVSIDKDTLKSTYKYQPSEFAARGIDITGKTWFSQCDICLPDWSMDSPNFFEILNEQLPVRVHCFSTSLITRVDVNSLD